MQLLEGKTAVIYGAGGAIGGAVARAFAREGAHVHLAGRTPASLEVVARDIGSAGGRASVAVVDALDAEAVEAHAVAVGDIDIAFNAISVGDVQGTPLVDMSVDDFLAPIVAAARSNFLTWTAAARRMIAGGRGGVILCFGGGGNPLRDYSIGGFQIALEAVEALRRQLSTEAGKHGVRVVTLRTGGIPETIPSGFSGREALVSSLEAMTLTGRCATLADVGNVAAFVASDLARTMTGATVNISAGALLD